MPGFLGWPLQSSVRLKVMHANPDPHQTPEWQQCYGQTSSILHPWGRVSSHFLSTATFWNVHGVKNDSIYASCRTRASARQRVAHWETRSLSRTQLVKILHMLKAHTAQTHSHGRTPSVGNLLIQTWSGEGWGSLKLKYLPLQIVAITVGHLIWTPLRVYLFFFPPHIWFVCQHLHCWHMCVCVLGCVHQMYIPVCILACIFQGQRP